MGGQEYLLTEGVDGGVLPGDLFSLRDVVGLDGLGYPEVLPDLEFKGLVDYFETVDVAVMVDNCFID